MSTSLLGFLTAINVLLPSPATITSKADSIERLGKNFFASIATSCDHEVGKAASLFENFAEQLADVVSGARSTAAGSLGGTNPASSKSASHSARVATGGGSSPSLSA